VTFTPPFKKKNKKKRNNPHIPNTFDRTLSKKGISIGKNVYICTQFPARGFAGQCEKAFVLVCLLKSPNFNLKTAILMPFAFAFMYHLHIGGIG